MATGCAGDQDQLQGHALDRVAGRRAPASTTCSMATGCAGDQEQLQGDALDRVADRRAQKAWAGQLPRLQGLRSK